MPLRPELVPRKPDSAQIDALANLIDEIAVALEQDAPNIETLMRRHNTLSNRTDIQAERYRKFWASASAKVLAETALMGPTPEIDVLTRAEAVEIVERILAAASEAETDWWLGFLETHLPGFSSDLIYWPDKAWLDRIGTDAPSAVQIVEDALKNSHSNPVPALSRDLPDM